MSDPITSDLPSDWTLERFMGTIHEGRVALWSWDPVRRVARLDDLAREFWGGLSDPSVGLSELFARILPEDRDAARAAWLASATSEEPYEFRFRIRREGADRWIAARGAGGNRGRDGADVLAVFIDITALAEAEEAQGVIAREMAHRVKNLFAVVNALVSISLREGATAEEGIALARRRIDALSRASGTTLHDSRGGVEAHALMRTVLAPYRERIVVTGDDMFLDQGQVTSVGLILHELATNALKHGALSRDGGRIEIALSHAGDRREIAWREHGGPDVTQPTSTGFGSTLIGRMATSAGGTIERDWRPDGLHVRVALR